MLGVTMKYNYLKCLALSIIVISASITISATQTTTGSIRGKVIDPSGASIPNAKVIVTDETRNNLFYTRTTAEGEFKLGNLLPGSYQIRIESTQYYDEHRALRDIRVELNRITDVTIELIARQKDHKSDDVREAGTEMLSLTDINLQRYFNSRQVIEYPQTTFTGRYNTESGIYNLALLSSNISDANSVGAGTGGSVGGQRTRYNNFILDGIDNNRNDISGPAVYITPEAVAEFSLLLNQHSVDYARSSGGQFINVTRSGNNQFHGTAYGFFRNKHLNALDTLQKNDGIVRGDSSHQKKSMPRYDYARYGFNLSGPMYFPLLGDKEVRFWKGQDRLFFFTHFERQQIGKASVPYSYLSPTSEGMKKLNLITDISPENRSVLEKYVRVAPTQGMITGINGTKTPQYLNIGVNVCPCDPKDLYYLPIGPVTYYASDYSYRYNFVLNMDYYQKASTQHRGRLIYDRLRETDVSAMLPAFHTIAPTNGWLFSYTLFHQFTPRFSNETRIGYRRYDNKVPISNIKFPNSRVDYFPNIGLQDLGIEIGPNIIAPQSTTENNYQFIENVYYVKNTQAIKFGVDIRKLIAPQTYLPDMRGNYQYTSTSRFLRDISPNYLSTRGVGQNKYYGDQILFYGYGQTEWRMQPNLSVILGLNYAYQQVPYTARQQTVNKISSVPGLLKFGEPDSQKTNFGPRIGIVYSPEMDSGIGKKIFGSGRQSSIRAGFAMAYDVIVDHLYLLSMPPQIQTTVNYPLPTQTIPAFLATGGIQNKSPQTLQDSLSARASTTSWIPNQKVPYATIWNLTLQRHFLRDWMGEIQYLGTRGIHLPTQNRININSRVTDNLYLPTYLTRPTTTELNSLSLSLDDLKSRSMIVPEYANAGFTSPITAFLPNGNSTYHGFSFQLLRRFMHGLNLSAAYTWSKLIDDSTAEVFTTVLSPRRPQDFQNMRAEKSVSMMDRRNRFSLGAIYDLPLFNNYSSRFMRALVNGWTISGALTFASGEEATVLSGIDSNLNGDAASDRSIYYPKGIKGTSSKVSTLLNSKGKTVAYLADKPNSEYIQTGEGARSTTGRNTLQLRGINNLDFSIMKNFAVTERIGIQFRTDFLNAFNHPQYIPGSPNTVIPINTTRVGEVNTVGSSFFNSASRVFSSNPRIIQFSLRTWF